ncbi:MAG: NADH-quinone oxidoreductase subunit NuoK [Myxococcales bacterium]|nr:NADH-quinone oxidoreductase subunit NuoK [Myxococcales bacterium]
MPLSHYLILSVMLFSIGLIGVVVRRNAIVVLMSVELMLNSANLAFIAFAKYWGDLTGHVFSFFVIAVAAAEAAVGLAIVINVFRHHRSTSVDEVRALKG